MAKPKKKLHPRGKALRWMSSHRYCTEQPPGSNSDKRQDGIRAAQTRLAKWLIGAAWCGIWCCNAALAGGVKMSRPYRWASVWFIEVDAKNGVNGFRAWVTPRDRKGLKRVRRGDLAVLFGSGTHVAMVRSVVKLWRFGLIRTDEGNTSSGNTGSQSNGGGSYPRWRRLSDVYGFALVDYPN